MSHPLGPNTLFWLAGLVAVGQGLVVPWRATAAAKPNVKLAAASWVISSLGICLGSVLIRADWQKYSATLDFIWLVIFMAALLAATGILRPGLPGFEGHQLRMAALAGVIFMPAAAHAIALVVSPLWQGLFFGAFQHMGVQFS